MNEYQTNNEVSKIFDIITALCCSHPLCGRLENKKIKKCYYICINNFLIV